MCLETDVLHQSSPPSHLPYRCVLGLHESSSTLGMSWTNALTERAIQTISLQAPGASSLLRACVFTNIGKCGYLDSGLQDRLCSKVINVSHRKQAGLGVQAESPHRKYHLGSV